MGVSFSQFISLFICPTISSHMMEIPWFFESETLILIITFRKSALSLSIGWEMLWYCALLGAEDPLHPMMADNFLHHVGIIWLVVRLFLRVFQTVISCRRLMFQFHLLGIFLILCICRRYWVIILSMLLILPWGILFLIGNVTHYLHPFF